MKKRRAASFSEMEPIFKDRAEAGKALAARVEGLVHDTNLLILGLPRGGVPVAVEVARVMNTELDVFIVRKLGLPGQEELAIGAIASGGVLVLNESLIAELQLSRSLIDEIARREQKELERREELFREGRPRISVQNRTIVLVDDGLATGATMKAAARALRMQQPNRIVVGVPVASEESCKEFQTEADQIICLHTPAPFLGVGMWYEDFSQTTDEEVQRCLEEAAQISGAGRAAAIRPS